MGSMLRESIVFGEVQKTMFSRNFNLKGDNQVKDLGVLFLKINTSLT